MQRALISGVMISGVGALLGTFVILRRLTFFSDAISHSALAGIALGLLLGINPFFSAVIFCIAAALWVKRLREITNLTEDILLGVLFASATAAGVLIIGFLKGLRVDLFQFLFGDILGVGVTDIVFSAILCVLVAVALFIFLEELLGVSFNPDLAMVSQERVRLYDYLFMVLLASAIAASIRIFGVILVSSLIIIPASVARNIARSFKQMLLISVAVGIVSSIGGLISSYYLDTPSGPTIVIWSMTFFMLSLLFRRR
ncbi:MAG: metal ABC transporter permease [Bacteroidetes bacterium]|nr:metal ABC transporter permease [Bacteroidota bacterium]